MFVPELSHFTCTHTDKHSTSGTVFFTNDVMLDHAQETELTVCLRYGSNMKLQKCHNRLQQQLSNLLLRIEALFLVTFDCSVEKKQCRECHKCHEVCNTCEYHVTCLSYPS